MRKMFLCFAMVIVVITALFSALPITASAKAYEIYTYIIENGEVIITDCEDLVSGDIEIPVTIEKYPVTAIGDHAFAYCCYLTSVTIPVGVTEIGNDAFYACSNLTDITIPDSITNIGWNAFSGGAVTNIIIPDGVTDIKGSTFSACCDLTSVTIPVTVTSIGDYAFWYCHSLTDVYYGGTEDEWNNIEFGEENEWLTNATIHFTETSNKKGDINDDGKIDIKDIISIRRFISGSYGITIDVEWADVYEDGNVDIKDVILLRRYINGRYGVEL